MQGRGTEGKRVGPRQKFWSLGVPRNVWLGPKKRPSVFSANQPRPKVFPRHKHRASCSGTRPSSTAQRPKFNPGKQGRDGES